METGGVGVGFRSGGGVVMIRGIPKEGWKLGVAVSAGGGHDGDDQRNP